MFEWLVEFIASTFEKFDGLVTDAAAVLSTGFDAERWANFAAMSETLKSFCLIVLSLCVLLELAQVAAKVDLLKWEHGLKAGVKLVLAKVCIDVAPNFLKACYMQSIAWVNALSEDYTPIGSQAATAIRALADQHLGIFDVLLLAVSMLIVLLGIFGCGAAVKVIAYGRMFELYVYLVISPLPCAFFPLGDGSGGGMSRITSKFLKSFAAVCLQGVLMVICIRIFGVIIGGDVVKQLNDILNPGTGATADVSAVISDVCYTMLLGSIVLVGCITKCSGWAKSLLDAM